MERFRIEPRDAGRRLDAVLADRLGLSHARVRRLFAEHAVRVDGRVAKKGEAARAGVELLLTATAPRDEELRPSPEPELGASLEVLHEDALVVAVAKPAGMPSHPLRAGETGTVAGALVARFPECARAGGDPREAGLANRLDVGASGILLAARTPGAWSALREAFRAGQSEKTYLAVSRPAAGSAPTWSRRTVTRPLAHDPRDARRVLAVGAGSEEWKLRARSATTELEILGRHGDLVALRAGTRTGRMHQIRAHCASEGLPLYGDTLYGGAPARAEDGLAGFALHAESLAVPHPAGGLLRVQCPPPRPMRALLRRAGFDPPAGR